MIKKGARAHYDAGRNCEERSFRATREMFLFAGFNEKDLDRGNLFVCMLLLSSSYHWLQATQFFDLHIKLRGSSMEDKPQVYLS